LENHLQKLGIKADKAMKIIKKRDIDSIKKSKYSEQGLENTCDINLYHNGIIKKFPHKLVSADVFFLHPHYFYHNKRFYQYPKYFANLFDHQYLDTLINKYVMNQNLVKINPNAYSEYLLENFLIDQLDKYQFPGLYILRPIDEDQGNNIFYVSNLEEVKKLISFYQHAKNRKNKDYSNQVVATPYITNPLLFDNKKFHLRLYILTSFLDGKFYSFIADFGKIYTSDKPFNLELPFDKSVHDTHAPIDKESYNYPEDMTKNHLGTTISKSVLNKINQKIRALSRDLAKLIGQDKSKLLHQDCQNGYYFYGIDVMITDEMKPILIEVNTRTGTPISLRQKFYNWINRVVLEPFFLHKNPDLAKNDPTFLYSS
jgi:hypothetical protein